MLHNNGDHTPVDVVEIKVKDDEYINLENLKIKAMYTPGHTKIVVVF